MQDYYEILSVPRFSEDPQAFRKAYKEQVLFFHPDKGNVNESIAPSEIDSGIFTSDELERELHSACIPFERYRSRIKETCEFLESPDAGYGSQMFYASEKLIVMDRNAAPQPLTLVVDYTGSLGILLEQDTDAAQIRFSENVWYDRATQLQIVPEHPGTTVFTFRNDRNGTSFRVRVIVL
jgi:hypothetical protein